jgi:hypothetical protein
VRTELIPTITLTGDRKRDREKCKSPKPITPAILRQQRSAERLRRFDRVMICGYGLLASILVLHLVFGGTFALPTGGQKDASLHSEPAMSLPAKFVSVSWLGGIHQLPERGLY